MSAKNSNETESNLFVLEQHSFSSLSFRDREIDDGPTVRQFASK